MAKVTIVGVTLSDHGPMLSANVNVRRWHQALVSRGRAYTSSETLPPDVRNEFLVVWGQRLMVASGYREISSTVEPQSVTRNDMASGG